MKIVTKLKISILILALFLVISCIKYKEVDLEYDELKELPNDRLTKLELVSYVNMDTVNSQIFETSFKMKNVGTKTMKNIFIKGNCGCTTIADYKNVLRPNEEQNIQITIDLEKEKGNFLKEVFLYGTFYPYQRKIQIVGYKK
ncbi:MAG: hypothetical protein CVU07_09195 [Bacteroidetes bacterium HGW-Bacteroidetes-23]|nr:MAG: hypothetical protein CVU07_09195 [Bacteroidetes bacterium HGW-Bacteroidetes-23]